MTPLFAEVLLPLPLRSTFTYSVPEQLASQVKPGHRVVVPFGRKKFYTGIVTLLTPLAPEGFEVKPVMQALDSSPIIRHPQFKLWQWMADYYLCSQGEVYKAALPAGLKIESETFIEEVEDFEEDPLNRLSEREVIVMQTLRHAEKRMTMGELDRATGFRNVAAVVDRLIARDAVTVSERLVERYRPKKVTYVAVAAERGNSDALHRAFNTISRAERQEKAFMTLLQLSDFMQQRRPLRLVTKAELMEKAGVSSAIIDALQKRGLINIERREVSRFSMSEKPDGELPSLSPAQQQALAAIDKSFLSHDITLLHGVTSSGKTEIYMRLIHAFLSQGRQVLYLVPEIALTTQLTRRLQRVFGHKVVIYHSKFSDNERVDLWRSMLSQREPCVVIGARSAMFLPFASLGLVIVDEEHESSYKQQDPAPRYSARDSAMVLASMHGAKTLLGSATPSVDTYHKALSGRYGLVELTERFDGAQLPEMELVDMSLARQRREVSGTFSAALRSRLGEALGRGEQGIIFLNRRGFAPLARCKMCGYVPKCVHCDVSLTYHKRLDKLVCHYCGTPYELPKLCPACQEPALEVLGYGTERLEDEIELFFPDATIARLDLDTTRNKEGYEDIIDRFSRRKTNLLVGTQMVTKGLDFAGVSVVGVVNADAIINYPDFRSAERAFNMLEQVAGRAGRRSTRGRVVIQTYSPSHPLFGFLLSHDYRGFYQSEITQRADFNYPPFTRVIYLYLKHRDAATVSQLAAAYATRLRQLLGTRVSGPDEPPVARVQSLYIRRIMLRVEVSASMKKVKDLLRTVSDEFASTQRLNGVTLYYDVDPQ